MHLLEINSEQSSDTVQYDLFGMKKNKLIWQGTLTQLKTFIASEVKGVDAKNITWKSPTILDKTSDYTLIS